MNRLIIIGNGFDLAHGLKTSYVDFITDYIDKIISTIRQEGMYNNDGLVSIYPEVKNMNSINSLMWKVKEYDFKHNTTTEKLIKLRNIGYRIDYSHYFIDVILNEPKKAWCDLENEYYKTLKSIIFRNPREIFSIEIIDDVNNLNRSFELLRDRFISYLNSLDIKPDTMKGIVGLEEIINSDINYDNFIGYKIKVQNSLNYRSVGEKKPKKIQILNFNYTSTIFRYFSYVKDTEKINFIHGNITDKTPNIIFGYGDEMDSKSKEIDEFDENRYLTHFKSFMYGKTSNYHNLINFINKDEFEVYIFGHSCGLSDRTMLNKIFEDKNCIHIKLFYHVRPDGSDDFDEKYFNISRHFNNKNKMREKILPKEKSIPFPQVREE